MERYCKHIGGYPVHWRDLIIHVGDTMTHLRGYHNSGVGISSVDQGMFSASNVSIYKINFFCQ